MNLPDQERLDIEVQSLAEEARNTPRPPTAEPPARGGVIAPIYMGKSHEVIPDRYVIHFSVTRCANCGTESRDNEFYALSYIRSRVNGTRVRHLTRCDRPLYNLPVDKIPTGIHNVPFCCECPSISLDHLPPPPQESQVYDLPEATAKGKRPKVAEPKAASLDDLI